MIEEQKWHSILLCLKNLEIKIYFTDPHALGEEGNKNINGLIRQFLPKGTDLSINTQSELGYITHLLNTKPRKRFEYQTPLKELCPNLVYE